MYLPAFQPCDAKMNLIARVIWVVCVRPEPCSGRSEAISRFPLGFCIAEHDDAGSGVAPLRAIAPLTATTSATVAITADTPVPA